MENIIITLCFVFSMVITYVIGLKTCQSFNNYKNIMKKLEEKNKCEDEDDKCCGCKYCNKNK